MSMHIRTFWILVVLVILGINAFPAAVASCDAPAILQAIRASHSYSCAEYWLNRYQTLLAGLTAIAGAWMTVTAMNRQSEATRRDAATRRLSEYSAAISMVMRKFQMVPLREAAGPPDEGRERLVRDLHEATINPTIMQGMTDSLLGPDASMLALFINSVIGAAEYPRAGDLAGGPVRLVWPLYMALTNGMTERQKLLSSGKSVADLQSEATINHRKFERAYMRGEPVDP